MRISLNLALISIVVCPCVWIGCARQSNDASPDNGVVGAADSGTTTACRPCVTDQDCAGGICTQLGADSYCAEPCAGSAGCPGNFACAAASSVIGEHVDVCVPREDVCGLPASSPGTAPADPSARAPLDAGAPAIGTITAKGGSLSRLLFAVVGDTRPAFIDHTSGYPTAVITKIFSDIEAFQPRPAFVVGTGDYMFASTFGSQAAPQLDLYLGAKGTYSGLLFPAMGNHECTGATASNCGPGTTNGVTKNYSAFLSQMLGPIEKSEPYYSVNIDALDKSWTAKFVFVAANAWTSTQATWLATTLQQSTTYTFIVRHESHEANTAPGVTPSEQIMAQHPYTLAIVGHTHTYEHFAGREVIIGNGGAPATGSKNYGFGIFSQREDGAIQVDMIDYATGASDTRFRFAVNADGTAAP